VGVFAAIYHPVGLAMVVQGRARTGMPLAINGVFGNLGVACAALMTGLLIDTAGWRSAFAVPGAVSVVLGALFLFFIRGDRHGRARLAGDAAAGRKNETASLSRGELARVFGIVFFTTALGGLIFQSTTFSLPEVFDEQLAGSATRTGWYAFVVFSIAALAQLAVGRLVDRYSLRVVFAVVALLQAILLFCMTRVSGAASVAVATAFMLVVFGQIPINDVLVSRVARSEWHSRAYAARYVVTFSVMASAVPLIAWIHGAWGFSRLFALLAVAASLIFVSVLLLPDTRALRRPAASAAPGGRRPPASTR
ncbi:MAG: MFS transporter, partial [Proteobacteria bacterium]